MAKLTAAQLAALARKQAEAEFPADFAPKPTVFASDGDAIGRMTKLWNKARDANFGGYGGGRLFQVKDWSGTSTVTSCSPFTATIIGMLFDPDGGTDKTVWEPKFDNGTKPLPPLFYTMHNGDFPKGPYGAARVGWFAENKWCPHSTDYLGNENKSKYAAGAYWVNDSARSLVWYGLGYEIDPRDMRRGDMIGLDWGTGGGHATFCWDVHLDDSGAVDCWLLLSSNSTSKVGVSVYTYPHTQFLDHSSGKWKATKIPYFDNDDMFITKGNWMVLPHLRRTDVKRETFKTWPDNVIDRSNGYGFHVAGLRVTRFWGFPPPDSPHGTVVTSDILEQAKRLTKFPVQPEPYSKGTCVQPGTKKSVSSKPVKKTEPEPKKAVAPAPVPQAKDDAAAHQRWVEGALAELYQAKWIAADPGKPDAITDAQSKAAIEDFQKKFKVTGEDGHGGPKTRAALEQARTDLHAGKPNPNDQARKPSIEQFYWSPNTVDAGGAVTLGVKGENLDLVTAYTVALTDKQTGTTDSVTLQIAAKHGAGSASLNVPRRFRAGATLGLQLSAAGITKTSDVALYIAVPPPPPRDWPWDEAAWPAHVRDIVAQLRAAATNHGYAKLRSITQYGVWDSVADGDVVVRDPKGRALGHADKRSLYLADLEGTMRLGDKILSLASSGNAFDASGKASFDRFDPAKSKWIDVCAQAPWGMGAKMPLIPFRTLAHDPRTESLYGRRVYIAELAGIKLPTGEVHNGVCIVGDAGGMQDGAFDLFIGPEAGRIALPATCNVELL